jgi:NADH dehydrogenase (ubiquinone) Fe-S protein 6
MALVGLQFDNHLNDDDDESSSNLNCNTFNAMLSTARSRAALLSRRVAVSGRRAYAFSANDNKEINVAGAPKEVPNVSKTNELPIENPYSTEALQENVEDAEKRRNMQAPNRANVWSRSQNPRAKAMSGPRFEQTIMELQVRWDIS